MKPEEKEQEEIIDSRSNIDKELEEQTISNTEQNNFEETNKKEKKKGKKAFWIILVIIVLLTLGLFLYKYINDNKAKGKEVVKNKYNSEYRMNGNSLQDFDLYFLKLENEEVNKIYSPLSIKYALAMLNEGAMGDTKNQITSVIGDYKFKKYINSDNMSLANVLFIRNSFKNAINNEYKKLIKNKFDGEVIIDEFKSAENINLWVKEKTLNLLDNLLSNDDLNDMDYVLINALAIDMEWVNKIQSEKAIWEVKYLHENRESYSNVASLPISGYHSLEFENSENAKSVQIGANANKYDIIKELGESNIKETVSKEYTEWLSENPCNLSEEEIAKNDVDTYMNSYMKEISSNYGKVSGSTDFLFYNDESVKVFAKDLKEYNGTTLQYVGIMPTNDSIKDYISKTSAKKLNKIISSLKPIELSSFKDGVVTKIIGYIPVFKYEYELNLLEDLKTLGVKDVFDSKLANLSKFSSSKAFITKAIHKANIEFSNDGIKASAATAIGGLGAGGCWFDHIYDVPVETIDLTFNRPYMYIIRDKSTGEVWFAGTVYSPTVFTSPEG